MLNKIAGATVKNNAPTVAVDLQTFANSEEDQIWTWENFMSSNSVKPVSEAQPLSDEDVDFLLFHAGA